jgi:hypothetical protein
MLSLVSIPSKRVLVIHPSRITPKSRDTEWNHWKRSVLSVHRYHKMEADMSFGKGALLWLIGIPLPIILLLALFMHH